MDAVANAYDARAHPDVKSRRRTEADVLREFLRGFETTRVPGMVTFPEFERYFASNTVRVCLSNAWFASAPAAADTRTHTTTSPNLSSERSQAAIDDDDYFALMMRQAWGVSE